jgi:uncharacterized protein YbjT (DUF2867 family)
LEITVTSPFLVTGGTGTLGRLVVPRLRDAGCHVRVLSRHAHASGDGIDFVIGDLAAGDGLDAAVAGVGTIVHCGGSAKGDDDKTRNLLQAASRADVQHVAYISVVGAERVPVESGVDRAVFGYFAAKRAAENLIAASGLPWTTLRATQFHDSMLMTIRQMAKLPVIPVPAGIRFQPVDTELVAARLVELSLGNPAGLVPEVAGPRAYQMAELIRSYLRAAHRHRLLMPVPFPGTAARAMRAGANLAPDRADGRTWEEFLAERVG